MPTLPRAEGPNAEVVQGGRTSANGHSVRVSCVGTLSALWPSISRSGASSAAGQRATQNSVCATVTADVSYPATSIIHACGSVSSGVNSRPLALRTATQSLRSSVKQMFRWTHPSKNTTQPHLGANTECRQPAASIVGEPVADACVYSMLCYAVLGTAAGPPTRAGRCRPQISRRPTNASTPAQPSRGMHLQQAFHVHAGELKGHQAAAIYTTTKPLI